MSLSQHPARLIGAAVAVLAIGLSLAGCTKPASHASAEPSTSATPSPTPTQAAIPQSGLPLGCADLADASSLGTHYKGDTVAVAVDEHSTAPGFSYRALQQGGGLHCVWGGTGRTDGGYDVGMELIVLTDAAPQYAAYAGTSPNVAWVADRYGDHSKSFCYVSGGYLQCYGDVLIGSTWLNFVLSDGNHSLSVDQAYVWADEQIKPVVSAISRAGTPRPTWKPGSAYDTSKLCDSATATVIAGAPVTVSKSSADASGYPSQVGADRAATAKCTWTSTAADANVDIAGLTGGAWALPGMTANLAEAASIPGGPAQPVSIPGADGAFVADGESAWGAVVTRGSLVEVFRDSSQTGNDDVPLLTRIAAYIDAHS